MKNPDFDPEAFKDFKEAVNEANGETDTILFLTTNDDRDNVISYVNGRGINLVMLLTSFAVEQWAIFNLAHRMAEEYMAENGKD